MPEQSGWSFSIISGKRYNISKCFGGKKQHNVRGELLASRETRRDEATERSGGQVWGVQYVILGTLDFSLRAPGMTGDLLTGGEPQW